MDVNKQLEDPAFANMTVTCQLALGSQIELGVNSSCSRWVGIIELVKFQDVDVFNSEGESVLEDLMKDITLVLCLHKCLRPSPRT